ncbi:MAG: hypothetical protein B7733_17645 [Myxococcales bacterium FL481]|nr:MAG: hypothetical protein B7733_17645 [Myxococcales bacterium FL481]
MAAIARRDRLSPEGARRVATDTLRLAQARLREIESTDPRVDATARLGWARLENLVRAHSARTWLREGFEPRHSPEDIPRKLVAANLDSPKYFHPRIHGLCNVMVVPNEDPGDGSRIPLAPTTNEWRTRAHAVLERVETRLRRWLPDASREPDCKLVKRLVALHEGTYDDSRLRLRVESGVLDVCRADRWDEGFVTALCGPATTAGWYGPFQTRFGLHLVAVLYVKPDTMPDADERDQRVRQRMLDAWRRSTLDAWLARERREHVRLLDEPTPPSEE